MPQSSASEGWIPLGDSAANITWNPVRVGQAEDTINNPLCDNFFHQCVAEWADVDGVTTARVPLAVNVALRFQGSGVRVFGSASIAEGSDPSLSFAIGLAVIDGKTGEAQAARFLVGTENDAVAPAFVQQNLDPDVQHTLSMDFANSPGATVSISNFEIFRGPAPTDASNAGSGSPVELGDPAGITTGPVTSAAPGTGPSPRVSPHTDTQPASSRSHSTSLPKGTIPAIVVAAVILAVATIASVLICLRKKRSRLRPHRSLRELEASADPDRTRKLRSYSAWSKHPEEATAAASISRSDRDADGAPDIAVLRTAMQRSGVSVQGILETLARERNGPHESLPSYGS